MRKYILFALLLWFVGAQAQNIIRLEYFIDADPGLGNATTISGAPSSANISDFNFAIPANVATGIHTIGFRGQDENLNWSLTNFQPVFVFTPEPAANISAIEFFIDTDPGLGNATAVNGFSNQTDVVNYAFEIPHNQTQGVHTVGYRTRDAAGKWSLTNFAPFYVNGGDLEFSDIVAAEYFWDTDAGFGHNQTYTFPTPTNMVADHQFSVNVPNFTSLPSDHTLLVRTMDSNGIWSHTHATSNGSNSSTVISISLLGIEELSKVGMKMYPNPVVDQLHIESEETSNIRSVVYDSNGKLIADQVIANGSGIIEMGHLSQGIYMVYLWKQDNAIHCVKIVKQ